MQEPLTLNDVVIIRDTAANRHDAVASLQGIVAGISRSDETGDVHAYAIWLPDLEEVWMFDISQLDATGQNDPNGIPMSDTSIRVIQRGELLDHRPPSER
jgi:hypothetical protein